MTQYSDFEDILLQYNWTGNGKTGYTTNLPTIVKTINNGVYTMSYNFLIDQSSTILAGYSSSDPEYTYMRAVTQAQKDGLKIIMHEDGGYDYSYSALFSDIAPIDFTADTPQNADITFAQADQDINAEFTAGQTAYVKGYDPSLQPVEKKYGDMWLNEDLPGGWTSSTDEGGSRFYTLLHELGHSMGLKGDIHLNGSQIDNQKYTVMSYEEGVEMEYGSYKVYPHTLQLFDILAIQEIFQSRNFATRSGAQTYTVSNMSYDASDADKAFLYTIWDGGGEDTISGAGLDEAVEIDLRQGRYSSIGNDAWGYVINKDADATGSDPDPGNVAIAYHTIIENATGTSYNDVLIGNAWDNILQGSAGDDVLYSDGFVYDGRVGFGVALGEYDANNGNDEAPDTDVDELQGGSGDDILYGGWGEDTLHGGADNDTVTYKNAPIYYRVTIDSLASGNFSVDKWYVGSNPTVDSADDTDTLYSIESFIDTPKEITFTFTPESGYGGTAINGDEFNNSSLSDPFATGPLTISGYAGNDGLQGNDWNDKLDGGADNDTLNGGAGNDQLLGGSGVDFLYGSSGDDYMDGGADNDTLGGGPGNDLFIYSGGNDTFERGTGYNADDIDTAELQGISFSDITFSRAYNSSDVVLTLSNGDVVTFEAQNTGTNIDVLKLSDGTYYMKDIQIEVSGSVNRDIIYGAYSLLNGGEHSRHAYSIDDIIYGGAGNDDINAYHGNNIVYGEGDNDKIWGGNDSDFFSGGTGRDYLYGNYGNDFLYGDEGDDYLYGSYGSDALFGGAGTDDVRGDDGNDYLEGGTGNDTLRGGKDHDTYFYASGDGLDTIIEAHGNDILEFGSGIAIGNLSFNKDGNNLEIGVSGVGEVKITNYYYGSSGAYEVEILKFADGSMLDTALYAPV